MTNENSPNMGPFISELRKEKNLTQRELADQLGVTDKAVSKWERGLSYPDISLLSKLARIFGITTDELLNGEKADLAAPAENNSEEVKPQVAGPSGKNPNARNTRWKHAAAGFGAVLLSLLIFIGCNAAIEGSLAWVVLPLGITTTILVLATLGAFVAEKKKIGALLLCGFLIYLTTNYYSALNKSPARIASAAGGNFPKVYLPHYTIVIALFVVSITLIVVTFWIRNKNHAGDIPFLLTAVSVTILILSPLTVSAIIDYVDLNGLGVDARFTILTLLTILINLILLAVLARQFIKQSKGTSTASSNP